MPKKTAGPSRLALTVRSLMFMGGLGGVLAVWNVYSLRRDVAAATGPQSASQQAFLVEAANRPDITLFYQKLTSLQRVQMAQNIGRYTDPGLAKLCGKLLGDFDPAARQAVATSLGKLAKIHPDAVAAELTEQGSFQQLGVQQALNAAGAAAIPFVVKELSDAGARANAEAYLVSLGPKVIASLLPELESSDKDVRIVTADTLGKIRAKEAIPILTKRYTSTTGDEQQSALNALAAIGDPVSEPLMSTTLDDASLPTAYRTEAAFGLGRIATPFSAQALWRHANEHDATLNDAVIGALQLSKDVGLLVAPAGALALRVASAYQSPLSDQVISKSLKVPEMRATAARYAFSRPTLVPVLTRLLGDPNQSQDGEVADAAIGSLESTKEGRSALERFRKQPTLAGLIQRREQLQS